MLEHAMLTGSLTRIACVRRDLWSHEYFSISHHESDMMKIPRALVNRFIDSLCYAA